MRSAPSAASLSLLAAGLAACAPSRGALVEPVAGEVRARTGLELAGPQSRAQVEELLRAEIDADAAARIALLSRPRMRAALEELGASGADLAAALAPRRVELELELRREVDGDDGGTTIELAAMADLIDVVQLPARRGAARAGLAAARARATRTAVEVAAEARAALIRAVAAGQMLALRTTIFEAADASFTLARSLREAGNITELALVQEEALYHQARIDLAAAQLARAEAHAELAAALGLFGEQARLRVVADLGGPPALPDDLAGLERAAVERSLELAELRARAEAASRQVGLARWRTVLPELGAGVSAEREEGSWAVGPAVSVSLPLLDWGQGERGRAWAELRQTRALHAESAVRLRAAARMAAQRVTGARERAVYLRDVLVPLRRRILDATLLQYNAMQASPFELMQARQAQAEAEVRLVEALRDAHLAAVEADRLRAGGAPGGLGAAARPEGGAAAQTGNDH